MRLCACFCISIMIVSSVSSVALAGQPMPPYAHPAAGTSGDGIADAIYDRSTGTFTIDPDGVPGGVGLFHLVSESRIFTGAATTFPPLGVFLEDEDDNIGWVASPGPPLTPITGMPLIAPFNLGRVAERFLDQTFLHNDLQTISSGGFGTPNVALDLIVVGVPEPSSAMLLNLGAVALALFRRRIGCRYETRLSARHRQVQRAELRE